MENGFLITPTRKRNRRTRSVLGDFALSDSRLNVPSPSPSSKERRKGKIAAANRLVDFTRVSPLKVIHSRSKTKTPSPRQNRLRSANASLESPRMHRRSSTIDNILDIGDANNPIVNFRPQLWRHLEKDRDILNLDLFWPQKFDIDDHENDDDSEVEVDNKIFPLNGLEPLCEFRKLRSLRIGGMLQSYQQHIWRVCWVNPGLEDLNLEMALSPEIIDQHDYFQEIKGSWNRKQMIEACTDYLGEVEGSGLLCEDYGFGEYLDKHAIAEARSAVSVDSTSPRYLPIVNLTLAGFVVDAGPFFRWFSPMRLRRVEFKHGCVDAGFALPAHMSNLVAVDWQRTSEGNCTKAGLTRVNNTIVQTVDIRRKYSGDQETTTRPGLMMASLWKKTWLSSSRVGSLKGRRVKKAEITSSSRSSFLSTSSDPSLSRQKSSSLSSSQSMTFGPSDRSFVLDRVLTRKQRSQEKCG